MNDTPVGCSLRVTGTFRLVAVARLEWTKFGASSPRALQETCPESKDGRYTRLNLGHVPVIDKDGIRVDYPPEENIAAPRGATRRSSPGRIRVRWPRE